MPPWNRTCWSSELTFWRPWSPRTLRTRPAALRAAKTDQGNCNGREGVSGTERDLQVSGISRPEVKEARSRCNVLYGFAAFATGSCLTHARFQGVKSRQVALIRRSAPATPLLYTVSAPSRLTGVPLKEPFPLTHETLILGYVWVWFTVAAHVRYARHPARACASHAVTRRSAKGQPTTAASSRDRKKSRLAPIH